MSKDGELLRSIAYERGEPAKTWLNDLADKVEKAEAFGVYPWGPAPPHPRWERPRPTHYTVIEGGMWFTWGDPGTEKGPGVAIHAIKFSDNTIFDAYNGWRSCEPAHPGPTPTTPEPRSAPSSESATPTDTSLSALLEGILLEVRTIAKNSYPLFVGSLSMAAAPSNSPSQATTLIAHIKDLADQLTDGQLQKLVGELESVEWSRRETSPKSSTSRTSPSPTTEDDSA